MSKKKLKQSNRWVVIVTIIFFLSGFYAGGHFSGMRLQNFKFVKGGTIIFENLKSGQKIFIDNKSLGTVLEDGGKTLNGVTPGKHNLIVTKTAFWPWGKEMTLTSGDKLGFKPFLIAQIPNVEILTLNDKNFQDLKDDIVSAKLPSIENILGSSDGKILLWLEGNRIMLKSLESPLPKYFCNPTCDDTLDILDSSSDIKAVYFFPNRSDVILFSTLLGIFALEVDGRGTRNFQPMYKGEFINFAVFDNKIFVLVTEEKIYNILP